jgi:hypothetical protein
MDQGTNGGCAVSPLVWKDIDKEVRPLVRAMNMPELGMRTRDSCAGHPRRVTLNMGEPYVGFQITDRRACSRFWQAFWRFLGRRAGGVKAYSKTALHDGKYGVGFFVSRFDPPGLSSFHGLCPGGFYRLRIETTHNTAHARGRAERLYGLGVLTTFIHEYVRAPRGPEGSRLARRASRRASTS